MPTLLDKPEWNVEAYKKISKNPKKNIFLVPCSHGIYNPQCSIFDKKFSYSNTSELSLFSEKLTEEGYPTAHLPIQASRNMLETAKFKKDRTSHLNTALAMLYYALGAGYELMVVPSENRKPCFTATVQVGQDKVFYGNSESEQSQYEYYMEQLSALEDFQRMNEKDQQNFKYNDFYLAYAAGKKIQDNGWSQKFQSCFEKKKPLEKKKDLRLPTEQDIKKELNFHKPKETLVSNNLEKEKNSITKPQKIERSILAEEVINDLVGLLDRVRNDKKKIWDETLKNKVLSDLKALAWLLNHKVSSSKSSRIAQELGGFIQGFVESFPKSGKISLDFHVLRFSYFCNGIKNIIIKDLTKDQEIKNYRDVGNALLYYLGNIVIFFRNLLPFCCSKRHTVFSLLSTAEKIINAVLSDIKYFDPKITPAEDDSKSLVMK